MYPVLKATAIALGEASTALGFGLKKCKLPELEIRKALSYILVACDMATFP